MPTSVRQFFVLALGVGLGLALWGVTRGAGPRPTRRTPPGAPQAASPPLHTEPEQQRPGGMVSGEPFQRTSVPPGPLAGASAGIANWPELPRRSGKLVDLFLFSPHYLKSSDLYRHQGLNPRDVVLSREQCSVVDAIIKKHSESLSNLSGLLRQTQEVEVRHAERSGLVTPMSASSDGSFDHGPAVRAGGLVVMAGSGGFWVDKQHLPGTRQIQGDIEREGQRLFGEIIEGFLGFGTLSAEQAADLRRRAAEGTGGRK